MNQPARGPPAPRPPAPLSPATASSVSSVSSVPLAPPLARPPPAAHDVAPGSGEDTREGTKPGLYNGGPPTIDAGLRSLHHYRRALPRWRYDLRQRLLPLMRWETPYLARLQSEMRSPALDTYFAITANLGTHTFFMIGLPVLFWCGFPYFGKGLVHILASGVFLTGLIKDLCSLPRPLSPPLQRITMSGSAALEYGFPSTHSANAVSVAVFGLLVLHNQPDMSPASALTLEALAYFYALSIVVGRLYCGMHGFLDVLVGSLMGAVISLAEFYYGPSFEAWLYSSSYEAPLIMALVVVVLVRVHPEPADDCPCFDDSVAFAGVMIGLELGLWRLARSPLGPVYIGPDATFRLASLGWAVVIARVALGICIVFAWRGVMKPALLRGLPHFFRIIETHGLSLPRRYFTPASEYKKVPLGQRDDNVLPSVSDIPKLVRSIRGPGRGRSVSIGPQSAADAYETLAYRERRRRESAGSDTAGDAVQARCRAAGKGQDVTAGERGTVARAQASGVQDPRPVEHGSMTMATTRGVVEERGQQDRHDQQDELGEKEMFSRLVRPRVRYDVEVVTKLVVYTGISWLAVDLILVAFEYVNLGAAPLVA